mgnify:CR=1 FL=1
MGTIMIIGLLVISYLVGSIPWGFLLVKLTEGKDIRTIESGRVGGTNTMRAAGFWIGFITSCLDILKGAATVWIARGVYPDIFWLHAAAPVLAIIGHNNSIYLLRKRQGGDLEMGGGAGGAALVGGSLGLWWPSGLILIPLGLLIVFGLGYASVATMSLPLISTVIFAIRAIQGNGPWVYVGLGLVAELLILWALRPNIRRLIQGEERLVGWRARSDDQED